MYKDLKILCVIPARGGSKRLPGKNIKLLNGKPLIGYAIEAARGSRYIDRVAVSTDDENIAEVARTFGAEVIMRPAELATDEARVLFALRHTVTEAEVSGNLYGAVVLIQPTVPGVEASDVDAAVAKFADSRAHSCITVCEVIDPPTWMYHLESDGKLTQFINSELTTRSQDLEKLYRVNGAVYVTARAILMEGEGKIIDQQSVVGVVMPRERSTDIDTATDFRIAEALLK